MKTHYVLFLILFSITGFSQDKKAFSQFDTSGMKTDILIPQSPVIDITEYNQKSITLYNFYQAYKAVQQNDFRNRLKPLSTLKSASKTSYFTHKIPIAVLHSNFDIIKTEALQNQTVTRNNAGYIIRNNTNNTIFDQQSIIIAAPLIKTHKGLTVTFTVSEEHIYDTTENPIKDISINFDDGRGFISVNTNRDLQVSYLEAGKKTLTYNFTLIDGTIISRTSHLEITYSNSDLQTLFNRNIQTFNATTNFDLSQYGETTSYTGVGEYELFLSSDNILDKPILLVDGFDPSDSRDITGIYDLLNYEENGNTSNLGDIVRAEGFDLVILNFPIYTRTADNTVIDGGVDFIERNAMILVDLINLINDQKVGNAQNVIIGPSMGGLISRFALNYMESANLNHDTRLWISFDSPHHGANVPIGFQHQFNFLAYGLDDFSIIGNQNVEELQPIIDGMLTSSAARQMLVDQFEPHITNSDGVTFNGSLDLPRAHPFKTILMNSMTALTTSGFPEQTRNVTISNGSGINARYPSTNNTDLLPEVRILNANIDVMTGADLKVETRFTPYTNNQVYSSKVHLDFAWWFPLANDRINNATASATNYSNGVDAASGGLFDISNLTEDLDTEGLVGDFLNALTTNYFNFIPSVSSMAFEITNNEIDWFHTPSNIMTSRGTTNTTPFDAWYMPEENQPHVTLTPQNVAFAINEIMPETLSVTNETANFIKLEKNPLTNSLTLLSSQIYTDSHLKIIDPTGKLVYQNTVTLNKRTTIPIQLASGIYILALETNKQEQFRTKILVK
ncbi:T9SS type A sorting domain-containing protein [Bizionia sp. KMM 8389]